VNDARDALREIAHIAADAGPALVPAGHEELLRSITDAARSLFSAAACSLALLEDDRELVFHVASGTGADEVVGLRVSVSKGIAGWVATSGQPIAIEDVARDPRFASDVAGDTGYQPRSILAMPLQTDRGLVGVIEVLDRDTSERDGAHDMQLLSLFANQAALAIENSRVFSDLGRVLLDAVARISESNDLDQALEALIEETRGPDKELAEVAALFQELGRGGPEERRLAVTVLKQFLSYARARRWPS